MSASRWNTGLIFLIEMHETLEFYHILITIQIEHFMSSFQDLRFFHNNLEAEAQCSFAHASLSLSYKTDRENARSSFGPLPQGCCEWKPPKSWKDDIYSSICIFIDLCVLLTKDRVTEPGGLEFNLTGFYQIRFPLCLYPPCMRFSHMVDLHTHLCPFSKSRFNLYEA